MLKSIEVQGRTEDEAIELALEQLGLARDDVSVEILETAKTGLFGLKNTPAIVKVEYESDETDASEPEAGTAAGKTGGSAPRKKESRQSAQAVSGTTEASGGQTAPGEHAQVDGELAGRINTYLEGLFKHMDLEVSTDLFMKDGSVNVILQAQDPGVLIGRRGETLDALQHLTNYSVNRSGAGRVRIHFDAENYRKRRSEALESLAVRTAGKVVKYRRNMTLDPMNAYERHIIHSALQDNELVSTFSVGDENNRRVVIAYGQGKAGTDNADSPRYKEWH